VNRGNFIVKLLYEIFFYIWNSFRDKAEKAKNRFTQKSDVKLYVGSNFQNFLKKLLFLKIFMIDRGNFIIKLLVSKCLFQENDKILSFY